MNIKRNALLTIVGLAIAGSAVTATAASAAPLHPRRVEVNERLHNQTVRINQERRDGVVGVRKAWRLHAADYRVRMQERRYAFFHHGHISRAEQIRLNHQENRISHRIG